MVNRLHPVRASSVLGGWRFALSVARFQQRARPFVAHFQDADARRFAHSGREPRWDLEAFMASAAVGGLHERDFGDAGLQSIAALTHADEHQQNVAVLPE